ncbi:hypothetical protein PHMEG_00032001 [Phytophthora megakarya]|uniref:Uncharacterized protein n=1 Tax=Phytophthora megakarya TaxID=4795 RepID=A0A225UZ45_9STRA|nr:hypothetical protein PHMEG_00032001 [Phytophthora megakarya]
MVELIKYLGTQNDELLEAKLIRKKQLSVLHYWNWLAQFSLLRDIALTAPRHETTFKLRMSHVRVFQPKNFDQEDMEFYDMIDDLADASEEEGDNKKDSDYEYY